MPSLGVETAIVKEGQVLLIQRRDFRVWVLPGGAVDPGESLAQGAVREAREETGLDLKLERLVGLYSRPEWCDGGDHDVLFAARATGGQLIRENDEVADIAFFDPTKLPQPLVTWHAQRIDDVFSGASGLARTQHTPWPFDPQWNLSDVRKAVESGTLSMAEIAQLFGPSARWAGRLTGRGPGHAQQARSKVSFGRSVHPVKC